MNPKEIAKHYQSYHRLGLDVPFSLDGMSRVVKWRDRSISQGANEASSIKRIAVKAITEVALVFTFALSLTEIFCRNLVYIFTLPLQPFESLRTPSVRIQESVLCTMGVTLFSFEALRYNLVETGIGKKMVNPRLSSYYLDLYGRA